MSIDDIDPPLAVGKSKQRWVIRIAVLAIIGVVLYLPVLELYIRATSYSADGATANLWRQRTSIYNNVYQTVPLFSAESPNSRSKEYCYIDQSGAVVINGPFKWAMDFSEGLAAVAGVAHGEERWGFIDASGNEVIKPVFRQKPGNFREGLAFAVSDSGRWGYINKTGAWEIHPRFQSAYAFAGGKAQVNVSPPSHWLYAILCGDCGLQPRLRFIDMAGQYQRASDLRDFDINKSPPIPVAIGKYLNNIHVEYQNGDGINVLGRTYESGLGFNEGLAPAKEHGLWGYIDTAGAFVIQPKYAEAQGFRNGFAAVRLQKSGKFGMIDTQGILVVPAQYNWITEYRDGLIEVTAEQNGIAYWAYINLSNNQIWPSISAQSSFSSNP